MDFSETDSTSTTDSGLAQDTERQRLKMEILSVIEPFKDINEEPPFNSAELAVMAIICSEDGMLLKVEIFQWICETFVYYTKAAIKQQSVIEVYEKRDSETKAVVPGLRGCYFDWNAPFENVLSRARMITGRSDFNIKVPPRYGRIFLRRWLEPEREGTFSFLELPPEIRNTIYEMVFGFPPSGLCIDTNDDGKLTFRALEREVDASTGVHTTWNNHRWTYGPGVELPPAQEIFALLLSNKQIYKEAMPIFSSINQFNLRSASEYGFIQFAEHMPLSRVQHLTRLHIKFDLGGRAVASFPSAMEKLIKIRRLAELQVYMSGNDFLDRVQDCRKELGRKTKFTKFEQVPGLQELALAASRARKRVLHISDPKLRRHLCSEIARLTQTGGQMRKIRRPRKSKESGAKAA